MYVFMRITFLEKIKNQLESGDERREMVEDHKIRISLLKWQWPINGDFGLGWMTADFLLVCFLEFLPSVGKKLGRTSFIGYFDLILFEGINFSFNGFSLCTGLIHSPIRKSKITCWQLIGEEQRAWKNLSELQSTFRYCGTRDRLQLRFIA